MGPVQIKVYMPFTLALLRVNVKKMKGGTLPVFLEKSAGVVAVPRECTSKFAPAAQLRFQIVGGVKVEPNTATPVNVDDPADTMPKIKFEKASGNQCQRFLLVARQRVVSGLITLMTPEPA